MLTHRSGASWLGMLKMPYHAVVLHSTFPTGREVQLHSRHRTLKAAARALSKGITAARKPGPGWNTYCGIVTPDGKVMSLRQAQGKEPGRVDIWENLCVLLRAVATAAED